VWQAKDLRKGISGSVAMIIVTGWFFGSVATKGLRRVLEEAEACEEGVRSTARAADISGLARKGRAHLTKPIIAYGRYLSRNVISILFAADSLRSGGRLALHA
jgi:hypothetical protein